ncbi:virulence factor MVIN family protein [Caballeronia terrestris]|uniref:Virulence factor MVIN family protein n=1 Tax=Caballeronia terrestris TaxID=1226301 RepID=A0A158KMN3_9BURK|nr:lipid II flippase MurJ [Caballeronia terrestris]SAL82397.1 virulence factor MVIN family protein [Caballeronia terrestris]
MLTHTIGVLKKRILNVHVDHWRIAKGAVIVSTFVFLGKSAGAFKEMAIAYRYGIGSTADAYQLALTLVTWLPLTLTTELSILLIPLFVSMRHSEKELSEFLGELEAFGLVLGIALTSGLFLCWPLVAHIAAANLSESTREMCLRLIGGMAPIGVLSFTVCINAARLQARERHVNTLLECVPALVLLCFVLAAPDQKSLLPLMLGTSIGVSLQAILLRLIARNVDGLSARARFSLRSRHWRKTFHSIRMLLLGGVIVSLITPLDQYFLAQAGDGAIATCGYANRVLALLLGMGALAISRAILPILSEMLAIGDHARARKTAFKWSLVMLILGSISAAVAWFFGPGIIALLFQRGAFTAHDTAAVAQLFRAGLIQLPFAFAALVIIQLFVSEARYKALTLIALVTFVVKVVANALLVPSIGAEGVVIATGVMTAIGFICYLTCLRASAGTTA